MRTDHSSLSLSVSLSSPALSQWAGVQTCNVGSSLSGLTIKQNTHGANPQKRWWHDKLSSGTIHDPAMAYHPNAHADTVHTRKTKRLDTILVSSDTWDSLGVSGYVHAVLSHAGDHKAVCIYRIAYIQQPHQVI